MRFRLFRRHTEEEGTLNLIHFSTNRLRKKSVAHCVRKSKKGLSVNITHVR